MTHDRRMVPAALAAWGVAALLVTTTSLASTVTSCVATGIAALLWNRRFGRPLLLAAVCVAAIAASCAWRLATVEQSPLVPLAQAHRLVTLEAEVAGDARPFTHLGHESSVVEVTVRRVVTTERDVRLRSRATAFLDGRADDLVVGRRVVLKGRLSPSTESDEAATIDVVRRGGAEQATWWWEGSEHVREGVRHAVSHLADEPRALVPALVDGDDTRIADDVHEDFRRSGLTHLLAVSGTNLTIVLAVTMALARAAGMRRGWLWAVGAGSIIAFVLLARPEPSVVRAAAMGAVGVAAVGFGARGGLRTLCWAVVGLLFLDPWLARSAGFVLSVCATAGILLVAPVFTRRLEGWLPRWCALAVAVPLAAQLACTPAVAALSGEVSLV
ncbi:MAG: competence protein ComEC, partial [Aeromicrobium sp.]|nr:competence protein ComEC [Aeromicrobium sp.]